MLSFFTTIPKDSTYRRYVMFFREVLKVIWNVYGLYEGNLVKYFQVVAQDQKGRNNTYHNLFHTLWVVLQVYRACRHYRDNFTPMEMRIILIAALFHDFKHPGVKSDDAMNIKTTIIALQKVLTTEDVEHFEKIAWYIQTTQYPHVITAEFLDLRAKILRDADMSMFACKDWIERVVHGLANELGISARTMLERQPVFLNDLEFLTDWAKEAFGPIIPLRIKEAERMLSQYA